MKLRRYIYALGIAAMMGIGGTSCVDKDLPEMSDTDGFGLPADAVGDMLHIAVTLDDMGGPAIAANFNPNEALERYIDPDKVRILFFDEDDMFLFESKSRWIKQTNKSGDYSSWEILVPFFSYGNDEGKYDWDWRTIRDKVTKRPFKIAILANRPRVEWNLGINGKDYTEDVIVHTGWFGNEGPYWETTDMLKKSVFDLHHCQYDPIYDGKNWDNSTYTMVNGVREYTNYHFYDAFAEMHDEAVPNDPQKDSRPYMGATSSWVDWGVNDNVRVSNPDVKGWSAWNDKRLAAQLSESHPIPMYGIQRYAPLTEWKEGTTYALDRKGETSFEGEPVFDKPISLLRSVVKMELTIPKSVWDNATRPEYNYVVLYYPNVYARCEPMNTWTPTNEIWENDHWTDCEWQAISKYGPIAKTGDPGLNGTERDVELYQQRLSWLYGAWLEKNWPFKSDYFDASKVVPAGDETPYPRIMNSCIQRQTAIFVSDKNRFDDGTNYHWIAYVGERNVNDPSNLSRMGNTGSGQQPIMYWKIKIGANLYSIPICDNPQNYVYQSSVPNVNEAPPALSNDVKEYENGVAAGTIKNWPLLRNHVYRTNLRSRTSTRGGDDIIMVDGEVHRSQTIDFSKR
ncbi:MAG: hypothetical protein J1E97_04565 [Muribaculaceae bacterium]|nr:hypothetical protein [Muribaculaceae bacterium]